MKPQRSNQRRAPLKLRSAPIEIEEQTRFEVRSLVSGNGYYAVFTFTMADAKPHLQQHFTVFQPDESKLFNIYPVRLCTCSSCTYLTRNLPLEPDKQT